MSLESRLLEKDVVHFLPSNLSRKGREKSADYTASAHLPSGRAAPEMPPIPSYFFIAINVMETVLPSVVGVNRANLSF